MFALLRDIARRRGIEHILCGSNSDDRRPTTGRATGRSGVRCQAPLMEAQLTQAEIRAARRRLGLETADIPASPCVASRIRYGLEITDERLRQVEQARTSCGRWGWSIPRRDITAISPALRFARMICLYSQAGFP